MIETIDESETSEISSTKSSRSRNSQGIKEFCGRCTAIPLVKLAEETYSPPDFPPKLGWYKFKSQRDFSGSVLAAFELIEVRDANIDRYSCRAREREAIRANEPFSRPFCVDSFFPSVFESIYNV